MKIVTNGKKYRLWDKYEGFFCPQSMGMFGEIKVPWEGDTKREAEIRLSMVQKDNTWVEVE